MLVEMSKSTGYSVGDLSLIFTFFNVGIMLGQLTSIFYNRRFGKIKIILGGYFIIIPCLILLTLTNNLYFFYILYFLIGYIAGVIWLQATKYILENKIQNKDRLITVFLTFYPLGHLAAPQIASFLINHSFSWRYSYYFMSFLVIIIVILYLILKKEERMETFIEEENKLQLKKIFFNRRLNLIFIFGCVLMLFYTISETVISAWVPTFLRNARFFNIQSAGLVISIFWLAIIAGRIMVSFFAGRFKANYIILILSVIASASMIIFLSSNSLQLIIMAIIFAGFGYSGILTLGISSASTVYEKGRGVLASMVMVSANIGISTAPFITRFFSRFNMTLSVAMAPIFMLFTSLIIIGKIIYENIFREEKI